MLRALFGLGIVAALVTAAPAQAPVPRTTRPAGAAGSAGYFIEMLVLEGPGIAAYRSAERSDKASKVDSKAKMAPAAEANGERPVLPHPPLAAKDPAGPQSNSPDDLWDEVLPPGTTRIAAPRIRVVDGPATLQIQSEQKFTYFVPVGEGRYEAEQTAAQVLGMIVSLHLQPVEDMKEYVDLNPISIEVSSLDGREPIEGLDLDVGKPIVASRSLKTTARMKLGATRIIEIPSGPKTQAVLLLRVSRMEDGKDQAEERRFKSAKVASVKDQELVEISTGFDEGLRAGDVLSVFRDKTYLGKLTVIRVEASKSVARIEASKGEIRSGDHVKSFSGEDVRGND